MRLKKKLRGRDKRQKRLNAPESRLKKKLRGKGKRQKKLHDY